jgi:putative ABC transport system permease protein
VVQNQGFDILLDTKNEIAHVGIGEVGVPVYYELEYGIHVGDTLTLQVGGYHMDLTVSTIIRDSTMNSALSYSKRFLVNQSDLEEISIHMGEWEYCFEFLIKSGTESSVLQKDYLDAGMPGNGVSVTGGLLVILNGVSYGLVAFMILAIGMLLVAIALLCLSYIIRATMAEESYSIGEMKAIGLSRKAIRKLYLLKYILLVAIAGVMGYLLAIPIAKIVSTSVIQYCGEGENEWMSWVLPILGVILLGLIVVFKCRRTIHKCLKLTVVELMRQEDKKLSEGHYTLPRNGLRYRNLTIALGELKCKWKEYTVIFLVFVFASLLILIPLNMKNTVENPSFITYMGVGECDIRIDIPYHEKLKEQKEGMIAFLKEDSEIQEFVVYQNGYVQFQNAEGELEYLRVVNGDESVFPLEYYKGKAPSKVNEISLSYMNASEYGKEVGDTFVVTYQGNELSYLVSGIYQDITYGGKTAKAAIAFAKEDVEVETIYLNVTEGVSIEKKTEELRGLLTQGKVVPTAEFVSQTFGGIMDNMSTIEQATSVISLLLISLITVMFLQLITAREHSAIAIKKALGFSNRDLRIQFGIRILIIESLAIVIGTALSQLVGEGIFGLLLSQMGAAKITMLVKPLTAYLLLPAVQLAVVLITVVVGTRVVRNYHIRDQIME